MQQGVCIYMHGRRERKNTDDEGHCWLYLPKNQLSIGGRGEDGERDVEWASVSQQVK
jgi:hypothetical protein